MSNYWEIITWDKERIPVKPDNAQKVQDLIERGKNVVTPTRTIIASNVKDFIETDKPYIDKALASGQLLEEAAQAFNEPIFIERDSGHGYVEQAVRTKAVKRYVQRRKWDDYYSKLSYRLLAEGEGQVLMGWYILVENINDNMMMCTPEEIKILDK